MTLTRISTYNVHQTTLTNAGRVQAELLNLQNQISSGLKADTFSGMSADVEQYVALNGNLSRSTQFTSANDQAASRLEATSKSLDQIVQLGTDLKTLIVQRRNGAVANSLAFEQQLRSIWQALAGQLNSNLGGRYLFSGTATDVPAVNNTAFPVVNESNTPNDDYYLGSNDDIVSRVQEGFDTVLNVRGNDPAFQKMFASLAVAMKGHASNSDDMLAEAYDLAEAATSGVITVQTSVNANKVMLTQVNDKLASLNLYWKGVRENLVNTDLVSASTQVALDQGILQAAFQSFAKINSLRLSDFLQ